MHRAGVVGWVWQLWHFDAGVLAHCRCWFVARHLPTGASQGSLAAGTKVPARLRVLGRYKGLAHASCPSELNITLPRAVRAVPAVQVEDDHVATRLTDLLDKGACGRATFMPLNRLRVSVAGGGGGEHIVQPPPLSSTLVLSHTRATTPLGHPPNPPPHHHTRASAQHMPTPYTPPLPRPRAAPQRDLPPAVRAGRHPPHQEAQVRATVRGSSQAGRRSKACVCAGVQAYHLHKEAQV